jgi:hypothetical protein
MATKEVEGKCGMHIWSHESLVHDSQRLRYIADDRGVVPQFVGTLSECRVWLSGYEYARESVLALSEL